MYNAMLIERGDKTPGILFECDKELNKECSKRSCIKRCNHTTQIKYAKECKNTTGIIIRCKADTTDMEQLIKEIKELCIKNNIQPSVEGTKITIDIIDKLEIKTEVNKVC